MQRTLRQRTRQGSTVALVAVMVAAIGLSWIVANGSRLFSNSVSDLVAWVVTLIVAALAPILVLPRSARRGSEVGVMYGFIWALLFGLVSLQWIHIQHVVGEVLNRQQISESVALMALGIACFWVGYLSVRRHPTAPSQWRSVNFAWPVIVGSYVLGVASTIYLLRAGLAGYNFELPGTVVSSYTQNTLELIGLAAPVATYTSWIAALRTRQPRAVAATVVFTVGLMTLGVMEGSKWYTLEPPAFLALLYALHRGRLPTKWIAGIVIAFLLIIVPGNLAFRSQVSYVTPQSALVGTPEIAAIAGTGAPLSQRLNVVAEWLQTRLASIDTIALIVTQTPNPNPFQHGRLWALAPVYNVVPRLVWPNKPVFDQEYLFDRNYRHLPPNLPTNTGLTEPGDLFINFGLPGVVFGMTVLGLVFAWAAKWWGTAADPRRLVTYMVFLDQVLLTDHSVSDLLLSLPRMLVVAWLFGRVMMHDPGPTHAVEEIRVLGPAPGVQT